eukprot:gene50640-67803_t
MEFVVHVLERFFQKDRAAATQIMMHVHQNGVGECGVFTYEVAETKVTLVMDLARKHMHPLQCVMEKNLEQALHRALALANERHHEYATLEHLLLALVDDQDAAAVMRACSVDLDTLRRNLVDYIDAELANLVTDGRDDSKPTAGFQRVIQRAVIHVQSSGREEVTGANVLVAMFAERESHAAYFLQEQDMTRYDA